MISIIWIYVNLIFFQGIGGVEDISKKALETADEEAPRLIFFLDEEEKVLAAYIVGDTVSIFGQTDSVLDALIVYMACFYVFDLDYPPIYAPVLGFLQHWAVGDPYTGAKGTNWIKLSDTLARYQENWLFEIPKMKFEFC